jgi:cobalt/nickel transport system permease protein
MYRYVFVLGDELMRMKCARDARSFGGNSKWHIKTIGNIIGMLFIRTYERGERVYIAMVSRGFSGNIKISKDLHVKKLDLCFMVFFLTILTIIRAVL